MKLKYILILFIILFVTSCKTENKIQPTKLLTKSVLYSSDTNITLKTTIPSSVYSVLSKNKIIPNPFESCYEKKIKWTEELNWIYEFKFDLSKEELLSKKIKLRLKYIDTYAKLFINGKEHKMVANSFIHQTFNVKQYLKEGENIILIKLLPNSEFESSKIKYPGGNRVLTRKAQFQYGWDWAPSLNDRGIYGDVKLEFINDLRIKNVNINTNKINKSAAELKFDIEIESLKEENITLLIDNYEYNTFLKEGINHINKVIKITNPKLWWPHNYGEQNLYNFTLVLERNHSVIDSKTITYGIRKSEINQEALQKGSMFAIKINNKEIYMKGANIIPAHQFISEATDSIYISLVQQAKAAKMNMLRVWGGGYYLPEAFYKECDKRGIAVWQDFMFAGGIYPKSVFSKAETEQQIKRLNLHPSIVLWCGNNEISEGWQNWGWTDNLTKQDSVKMYDNYKYIFRKEIPKLVSELSANTPYWESSPSLGRGNPDYIYSGDAHNWWVWHDDSSFSNYENQIPRFMSEFGFQSLPHLETLKDFTTNNVFPNKKELKCHQKHHSGFERIESAMKRNSPMPKTIEDSVYLSQILQAIGIEKGIRAQRTNKHCKGSLFWQLNDCWPVISWSSIDFNGYWKALMYRSEKSFQEIVIRTDFKNDSMKIYIGNEKREFKNAKLIVELKSLDRKLLANFEEKLNIKPNQQGLIYNKLNNEFSKLINSKTYIKTSIISKQDTFVNYYFNKAFKNIDFQAKSLDYKINKENSELIIYAKSFNAFVAILNNDKILEDNYFHMEAGEKKLIKVKDIENLKVISLNKFY